MYLRDITKNIKVVRDGEFHSLGFVSHRTAARLVFVEDQKFLTPLSHDDFISCVITTDALADHVPSHCGVAVAPNPRIAFYTLHNYLAEQTDFYWKPFETIIAPEARIHPHAFVASKNVRIGAYTIIEPGVQVLERSIIGEHVVLRAGVTVGTQGFEFKRIETSVLPVAHAGGVRIGDRVEIQANSAISRSVFGGFTQLGNDTKLDNLVHIAHNVTVGQRCLIAASAMIAGSTTLGDDVWIGPGASVSSEITIGDGASITIGSVVVRDVAPGQRVTGNFAVEHRTFMNFMRSLLKTKTSS